MSATRTVSYAAAIVAIALGGCGKVRDGTGTVQSPPNTFDTGGHSGTGNDGGGIGGASASGAGASAGSQNGNGGNNPGGAGSSGAMNAGGVVGLDGSTSAGGVGSGGVSTGGTAGSGGSAGSGGVQDIPPDILNMPTVWVGEVESIVSYPTVVEGLTGPEKVTLVLDAITNSVTGTISFGEGPQPNPDPSRIYPAWTDMDGTWPTIPNNWMYSPFPGFPYTIVSSELKGNRLSINFAPVEIFAALCAQQSPSSGSGPFCECTATECHGLSQPLRRLDLVVTGNVMAGEMTRPAGNWLGGVPAIRLTRIQ